MSTTASRKVSIGEFINNTAVKFNVDGEILPLVFPRSRIPVRFDREVVNFWSAPLMCGSVSVYSLGVSAEGGGWGEQRQGIDRTAGSQRKFKGQGDAIDKKINHKMRSCRIWRKRHGV